jgi:hypothetical protein
VAGHAQLSDEEYIERSLEGPCDFVRYRNAASRQCQHDDVFPAFEMLEAGGELDAGVVAIAVGSSQIEV